MNFFTVRGLMLAAASAAATVMFPLDAAASDTAAAGTASSKTTIAVLRDGPSQYFDQLARLVQQETETLVAGTHTVEFRFDREFDANWEVAKIAPLLDRALADPAVDIILAAGILTAQAASDPKRNLAKPVISGFVQDPDAAGMPYNEAGYSTKTNFTFIITPLRSINDLEAFHQLVPFKKLAVVIDSIIMAELRETHEEVKQAREHFKSEIALIPANDKAADVIKKIPMGADAVYLTPALRMPPAEWQLLIQELNRRRLPTFSLMGHQDVALGALAGLAPDCGDRLARRIALNLQQIMQGTPADQLPVIMTIEEKLVINDRTAVAIGFNPALDVMIGADFINWDERHAGAESLSMADAMHMALANNLNLAVKRAATEIARQERGQAMSTLLPQAAGYGDYTRVDDDSAANSMGAQPRAETRAGLRITQMLYNDPLISQYRAARASYAGARDEYENTRLDIMGEAATAFLNHLQSEALLRTEDDNLKLTLSNLAAARARRQAGMAGPEEVYRWESQAASQKARLIEADTRVNQTRVALNQILGADMRRRWQTAAVAASGTNFHFLSGRMARELTDQRALADFEEFTVRCGLRNSPLLMALDQGIAAREIILAQEQRKWFLPEFSAAFNFAHAFDRDYYYGAEAGAAGGASNTKDDEWSFTAQATFPLLEGGRRRFDVGRARASLDELRQTRARAAQLTERNIRTIMYALTSSYPNMQLQRTAADFSTRNLDVIKDKYIRGNVSILELLDAQNQAFTAGQNATLAVYSYVKDLYDLQRAISWFEAEKSAVEQDEFISEFAAFRRAREK